MQKVSPLQKYEPKDWSGLTTENHLGALYALEPQVISPIIEYIYKVNLGGNDVVSFMDKFETEYLDDDRTFEWFLQGADEKNIPLITYYNTDKSTKPTRPGIARSQFIMVFPERWFEFRDVIVGHKPDLYKLRVVEEPTSSGANFFYKVELVTGDDSLFVPTEELAAGKRWSKEYSLVTQTLSNGGGKTTHTSPFKMFNNLSMIRKEFEVPGNMILKGVNKPLAFSWRDPQTGVVQSSWIKKLDWDFLTQFKREIARLLLYGNSNRMADGTYGNKDNNGYEIRAGHGLYDQIAPSNIFYFNQFNVDWLTEIALSLSVGKLPEDQRDFVLTTGEYGMYDFHKSVEQRSTYWTPNFNQDRIQMKDGKMSYSGQFLEYRTVNGITFKLMHDPMRDNTVRNKEYHPDGGLVESRRMTIMDFGTASGEPNIRKVGIKGQGEMFRYIAGLRDPYSATNALSAPTMAASKVDGYEVHRGFIGGVRVKNPMRMADLRPALQL